MPCSLPAGESMTLMKNSGDAVRNELDQQAQRDAQPARAAASADQAPAAPAAPAAGETPPAPDAPVALQPIPPGGGRLIVVREGNRTTITTASLPPDVLHLARMAQETAFGLIGLLAVIIIVGPFARMIARRMERRAEVNAVTDNGRVLQQQLEQLQQSVDAMSLEVERISESQRFQSKLLYEKRSG